MPYRKQPLLQPWMGVDNSNPSLTLPSTSFKSAINWLINKGALMPLPSFRDANDVNPPVWLGGRSFRDGLSNIHTVLATKDGIAYYDPTAAFNRRFVLLTPPSGPYPNSTLPMAMEVFNNRVYFANGGLPLCHIDGDDGFYLAGNTPSTCFYLGKLASHLLQVCTTELNASSNLQLQPNRIRYSASGNADQWDETVDFTAGVIDIPDVEDTLTGWATVANVGYAFRQNGITVLTPTGVAGAPFFVENLSIGPAGIGCFYPYSLAVYGMICVFIAQDDVYLFTGAAPQGIGGKANKSIFRDIELATGTLNSVIIGYVPGVAATQKPGFDYLSYWLFIPQSNNTVTSTWVYHFKSQSWMNFQLPFGAVNFMQNLVLA